MANCGYVTAEKARGRGVASAMCAHSLEHARLRWFEAMQFKFVVSTNDTGVRLWQKPGFRIVGNGRKRSSILSGATRMCMECTADYEDEHGHRSGIVLGSAGFQPAF